MAEFTIYSTLRQIELRIEEHVAFVAVVLKTPIRNNMHQEQQQENKIASKQAIPIPCYLRCRKRLTLTFMLTMLTMKTAIVNEKTNY
ncbi:hypothetical protein Ocin01_05953 [Orchesella cincta]|uniref:Uncharacterized protein n=1 Tax=Orchesella cincta TaxID=48709 RepID=A0A1D2N645_ORCCI|nr:hypothetical protein Ocin01_05953 [Orchesella cincta]